MRRHSPQSLLYCLVIWWLPGVLWAQNTALEAAVGGYLHEHHDDQAKELLAKVLAMPECKPNAVLAAITGAGAPLTPEMQVRVPHQGDHLLCEIRVPKGHDRSKARLPVVLDISNGVNLSWLKLRDVITVWVPGYTPPEFSDQGRDGFLKVLRTAAHLAHGDPDRLWLCGFSWAAHASFDTAEHRPGFLRGIVPMAGGPRWVHFRVLENLVGVDVLAFCGKKDDAVLVWNLQEVDRLKEKLHLGYHLTLDPEQGHTQPLKGIDGVAGKILAAGPMQALAQSGTLMVDSQGVENPLLRVDVVDKRQVTTPTRVPVRAGASLADKRRATIAAFNRKVASLSWTIKTTGEGEEATTLVSLKPKGVHACTVFFRGPRFCEGQKVLVKVRSKTVYKATLAIDPKVVLVEARRTGERLRPAFAAAQVRL
jgi:hypothetical protein